MIKNVTCKRSFIPSSNNAAPKKHPPPLHTISPEFYPVLRVIL